MNKIKNIITASITISVFCLMIWSFSLLSNKNSCLHNPRAQWATVNESAWFSMTPTDGDWTTNRTDRWFYELRGNTTVVVLSKQNNYYMVCYDYDDKNDPIMGWVYADMLILDSK